MRPAKSWFDSCNLLSLSSTGRSAAKNKIMGQFATRASHGPLPQRHGADLPVHAGKSILIIGAGGGIGKATAQLLAARGASVALADIREAATREAAANIPRSAAFVLDLADPG